MPKNRRTVAYNDLPPLPPLMELESKRALKQAIAANKALAELKGVGGLIPDQRILLKAIVLQEAKLSSAIENIVTTNDKLYRAFSEEKKATDENTKEVLMYQEALLEGYDSIKAGDPLSARLFVRLAQIINQADIRIRTMPGTHIAKSSTHEIIYTPPDNERAIRDLLDNLADYISMDDDIDPLIKLAVIHYQFEAIHPFPDGNGRTGRVLNILYLVERDLLSLPILYLSRYIIQNKQQYYRCLRRVTEDAAWEDWIVYVLRGIEETARNTRERILAIRVSLDQAIEKARDNMKKGYTKDLIEVIFQQPYTRIEHLEANKIAKRETASKYLHELERIGLLKVIKEGRDVLFLNEKLLNILASP
jgi:Fic family protein